VATWFFRDPERPSGAGVVAAADGRIRQVRWEPDGRLLISTYLSLRDVHVIRAPLDGVVMGMHYQGGRHVPAFRKDSARNERLTWQIATAAGEVELVQIAGVLARRIVPYRRVGDQVRSGDRIGLIRFGSRVDVRLPAGLQPAVAVGWRMQAGVTRLA
jgi:phosphatidylserine decarboxylase